MTENGYVVNSDKTALWTPSLMSINQLKKVGLFGATGMAGSAIYSQLSARRFIVTPIPRRDFEIGVQSIKSFAPNEFDCIVNAAGAINRRENIPKYTREFQYVNAVFPQELAQRCEDCGVPLIHISTDCVFDGSTGKYIETDTPSAVGLYGRSKLMGEPENAMVLRLSMVGPEKNNFYSLLCWFLNQKKRCDGFENHYWNGLTTIQLGKTLADIIENRMFRNGVQHIHSNDVTKFDLLNLFNDAFATDIEIRRTQSESPRDMRLRSNNPDFLASLNIPTLKNQIITMRSFSDPSGHWVEDAEK